MKHHNHKSDILWMTGCKLSDAGEIETLMLNLFGFDLGLTKASVFVQAALLIHMQLKLYDENFRTYEMN